MDNKIDTDVIQNIGTRTSYRVFDKKHSVNPNDIDLILHAAMSAPSAVNRRPWHFVVVTDRAKLDALAAVLPYCNAASTSPCAIVVCGDTSRFLDGVDSTLWVQDLSAASENILLAAHALSLGAVWTSVYPHTDRMANVSGILGLDGGFVPFNVIPLGYPVKEHAPVDKWEPECVSYI